MTKEMMNGLFAGQIFPEFPFKKHNWLAVAFERNMYDGARMPEWFFREASLVFNPSRELKLLVMGDCFTLEGRNELALVDFTWDEYAKFMRSKDGFSLEYKIASDLGDFACWADAELTVVGGEQDRMDILLNHFGGRESMLGCIEKEFFLDKPVGNEDMRVYFRKLLFPSERSK